MSNRKYQENSHKIITQSDATFMNNYNQFSMMGNFKNWLSQQKKIWK